MLLRKLISDVEEENSRLANMKLSLEESCEQVTDLFFALTELKLIFPIIIFIFVDHWKAVSEKLQIIIRVCIVKVNSNTIDKSNDIKQLREQIRKLDERFDCEMQVLYSTINIRLCQTSCLQMRDFCMSVFE